MQLDLADKASIKAFASEFESHYQQLDILIENAGVLAMERRETRDGFETGPRQRARSYALAAPHCLRRRDWSKLSWTYVFNLFVASAIAGGEKRSSNHRLEFSGVDGGRRFDPLGRHSCATHVPVCLRQLD